MLDTALQEGGPGFYIPALARSCGLPVRHNTCFGTDFDREFKAGASPERLASILMAFSRRNKVGLEERLQLLAERCTDEHAPLLALVLALTVDKVEKPSLNSVVAIGKHSKYPSLLFSFLKNSFFFVCFF